MDLDLNTLWWGVIILLFILSYVGLVVPGIPDAPLMLAGFLVYHFFIDDEPLSWYFWITMTILILTLISLDWLSGGLAAKKLGGSKGSLIVAPLGAVCFFWLPFGVLLGPMIACFTLEVINGKPLRNALKVATGVAIGFMGNIVVKIVALTSAKAWFFYLIT